jgi:hypothetical protein
MLKNILEKTDFYSTPFQFKVDKNKNGKKTYIGGLVSLIIISLSLLYIIYTFYLWFSGQLKPLVT